MRYIDPFFLYREISLRDVNCNRQMIFGVSVKAINNFIAQNHINQPLSATLMCFYTIGIKYGSGVSR